MSYYSGSSYDDELDIRVVREHRGRASPVRPVYVESPRHRAAAPRPVYYQHTPGYLLEPEVHVAPVHRSRSRGHNDRPPVSPPPAPVIINDNRRIYNDYESDEMEDDHYRRGPLSPQIRSRSRSRNRSRAGSRSSRSTHEDWELEKTRKELEEFKMAAKREEEEKRMKKELELERLRKEKRDEEEKKRIKKQEEEAVEKFKIKEAERLAKEKKEKEENEKEYKKRLEEDLRKSGLNQQQIAQIINKEKAAEASRPTYTRMSRRHLSIETLNRYRIDYEFDSDPDYVLIKRWVPEYEQDFLWNHTREIRERRERLIEPRPVQVFAIEEKKTYHQHHHKHEEPEFEFVRKKKHERKPSPSPLLTFLAGGKPR